MTHAAAITLYRALVAAGATPGGAWTRVLFALLDLDQTEAARRLALDWLNTDPRKVDP